MANGPHDPFGKRKDKFQENCDRSGRPTTTEEGSEETVVPSNPAVSDQQAEDEGSPQYGLFIDHRKRSILRENYAELARNPDQVEAGNFNVDNLEKYLSSEERFDSFENAMDTVFSSKKEITHFLNEIAGVKVSPTEIRLKKDRVKRSWAANYDAGTEANEILELLAGQTEGVDNIRWMDLLQDDDYQRDISQFAYRELENTGLAGLVDRGELNQDGQAVYGFVRADYISL